MQSKDDFTWASAAIRTLLVRALLALSQQLAAQAKEQGAKR